MQGEHIIVYGSNIVVQLHHLPIFYITVSFRKSTSRASVELKLAECIAFLNAGYE